MELEYSEHWKRKRKYRKDINDIIIEYAITNSNALKDKYWENALNAICRVPPSGRILKVVYRKVSGNKVKIITAFWLD
ncbi:MAG: hypothetical protein NTY20_05955 [Candidatus Aenigmarchaeota archaeon]|nr:hypothetical protein [Candidatus Aenigmarchaeota archaeon]